MNSLNTLELLGLGIICFCLKIIKCVFKILFSQWCYSNVFKEQRGLALSQNSNIFAEQILKTSC